MATKTNQQNNKERVRAAEILDETTAADEAKKNESEEKSKTEQALLAPRYLVPTFSNNSKPALSKTKLAAIVAAGIVLAALIGLYIYGATVA